jgi:hypothetical protein
MGHCGAEISNSFICNKTSRFAPEGLETTLFQIGCLAFRSPGSSDLCLKLKSSIVAYVTIAAITWWLLSHFLATVVHTGSIILALSQYATIFFLTLKYLHYKGDIQLLNYHLS